MEDPRLADFAVPISIVSFQDQFDEMRMFYIVNSRQKSVPTSLAQRHLDKTITSKGKEKVSPYETKKKVMAAMAIPIVDILRTHPRSPWYEKVQLPSETRRTKHIISQTSFADSIGYILSELPEHEVNDIRKKPHNFSICLFE